MNVNQLDINKDAYQLINAIHSQVTGQTTIAPTNTAEFVSVASKLLASGYDSLLGALSQVVTETYYTVRKYDGLFGGLEVDGFGWGNITRKVNFGDQVALQEDAYHLADGVPVDQQAPRKPVILETVYTGQDAFKDKWTVWSDQSLATAFHDESEFMRFVSAFLAHIDNVHTQWKESIGRTALLNFIGAKNVADSGNVLHVLTEYNTAIGASPALTAQDIMLPANFEAFIKWLNARVETLTDLMKQRSEKFHVNVTGYSIMRHTPLQDLKVYMLSDFMNKINSMVLPSQYHETYLTLSDHEAIPYWQSIDAPDEIQVTPSYLDAATGSVVTAAAQTMTDVIGVIFDRDAVAYQINSEIVRMAPYNADGLFQNAFYHLKYRALNDLTENAVVLVLD